MIWVLAYFGFGLVICFAYFVKHRHERHARGVASFFFADLHGVWIGLPLWPAVLLFCEIEHHELSRKSRWNRSQPSPAADLPTGTPGVADTDLLPSGRIRIGATHWHAVAKEGESIRKGDPVRVIGERAGTCLVEAAPMSARAERAKPRPSSGLTALRMKARADVPTAMQVPACPR